MIANQNCRVMVTLPKSRLKQAKDLAKPLEPFRGNRAFSWMVNQALKLYSETMDTSSGHPRPRAPAQLDIEQAIASTPSLPDRIRQIARELNARHATDFSSLAEHLDNVASRIEAERKETSPA